MLVYATPDIPVKAQPDNVFPLDKYALVRDRLLIEQTLSPEEVITAKEIEEHLILLAHTSQYWNDLKTGALPLFAQRRIGFPWSENLVLRALYSCGATYAAAYTALVDCISGALAGGTHHAHSDFGFGFCLLNDLAIVALSLLRSRAVRRVAIIDLDFHPGDGTAEICGKNPNIFTCSIHGRSILARDPIGSSYDKELSWGIGDEDYLEVLAEGLESVERFKPDLTLYQAGVDVLAGDELGHFKLSLEGVYRRDLAVFELCRRSGFPVAFTLGGGYHPNRELMIAAHMGTTRAAQEIFPRRNNHAEMRMPLQDDRRKRV